MLRFGNLKDSFARTRAWKKKTVRFSDEETSRVREEQANIPPTTARRPPSPVPPSPVVDEPEEIEEDDFSKTMKERTKKELIRSTRIMNEVLEDYEHREKLEKKYSDVDDDPSSVETMGYHLQVKHNLQRMIANYLNNVCAKREDVLQSLADWFAEGHIDDMLEELEYRKKYVAQQTNRPEALKQPQGVPQEVTKVDQVEVISVDSIQEEEKAKVEHPQNEETVDGKDEENDDEGVSTKTKNAWKYAAAEVYEMIVQIREDGIDGADKMEGKMGELLGSMRQQIELIDQLSKDLKYHKEVATLSDLKNSELAAENASLTDDCDKLYASINERSHLLVSLRSTIEEKNEEIKNLEKLTKKYTKKEITSLREDRKQLMSKVFRLNDEIDNLKDKNSDLSYKCEALEKELKRVRDLYDKETASHSADLELLHKNMEALESSSKQVQGSATTNNESQPVSGDSLDGTVRDTTHSADSKSSTESRSTSLKNAQNASTVGATSTIPTKDVVAPQGMPLTADDSVRDDPSNSQSKQMIGSHDRDAGDPKSGSTSFSLRPVVESKGSGDLAPASVSHSKTKIDPCGSYEVKPQSRSSSPAKQVIDSLDSSDLNAVDTKQLEFVTGSQDSDGQKIEPKPLTKSVIGSQDSDGQEAAPKSGSKPEVNSCESGDLKIRSSLHSKRVTESQESEDLETGTITHSKQVMDSQDSDYPNAEYMSTANPEIDSSQYSDDHKVESSSPSKEEVDLQASPHSVRKIVSEKSMSAVVSKAVEETAIHDQTNHTESLDGNQGLPDHHSAAKLTDSTHLVHGSTPTKHLTEAKDLMVDAESETGKMKREVDTELAEPQGSELTQSTEAVANQASPDSEKMTGKQLPDKTAQKDVTMVKLGISQRGAKSVQLGNSQKGIEMVKPETSQKGTNTVQLRTSQKGVEMVKPGTSQKGTKMVQLGSVQKDVETVKPRTPRKGFTIVKPVSGVQQHLPHPPSPSTTETEATQEVMGQSWSPSASFSYGNRQTRSHRQTHSHRHTRSGRQTHPTMPTVSMGRTGAAPRIETAAIQQNDYGGEGPEQRRVYDGATLRPNGHHANFFIAHTNAGESAVNSSTFDGRGLSMGVQGFGAFSGRYARAGIQQPTAQTELPQIVSTSVKGRVPQYLENVDTYQRRHQTAGDAGAYMDIIAPGKKRGKLHKPFHYCATNSRPMQERDWQQSERETSPTTASSFHRRPCTTNALLPARRWKSSGPSLLYRRNQGGASNSWKTASDGRGAKIGVQGFGASTGKYTRAGVRQPTAQTNLPYIVSTKVKGYLPQHPDSYQRH